MAVLRPFTSPTFVLLLDFAPVPFTSAALPAQKGVLTSPIEILPYVK